MQLAVRRFLTGADVEAQPTADVRGHPDKRVDHVVDKHIVARIGAVAEHPGGFAREQRLREDRYHTRFTVWVLARTVDVSRCDMRAVQAVEMSKGVQVDFAGHFARGIRRGRIGGRCLRGWILRRGAIDRSSRGGVHDLADTGLPRGLG
ncbi:Uncharacterised protein [Mycobacterium tuberculosis]|uniref:Uncharacterized protein n=1 Tax=Mycobacterium tuberculosis TaxID=1773 RepID=A0A0U0TGS2_MYCTX|nr:Uncharacterised protein [Mycobacterium tuberculosis]COX57854.1 Uncharacterised protein [Mycobacterium tuberculosis]COX82790.1 Uncharacterised protein [Mycobacterium tuberculosis]